MRETTPRRRRRTLIERINMARVWRRDVVVRGDILRPPTLDRLIALGLQRWGINDRAEIELLRSIVRPGMTAADVGANQGVYSLLLSRMVGPTGRVLAFEPEPVLHEALRANLERNRAANVEVYPVALGAERGALPFHRPQFHTGDSRLVQADPATLPGTPTVEVVPLDEIIGHLPIHVVKIDVQGWEDSVLAGMQSILRRPTQIQILFEFWPGGLRRAGTNPGSLLDRLWAFGLEIVRVDGGANTRVESAERLLATLRGNRYTNLLARRPSPSDARR